MTPDSTRKSVTVGPSQIEPRPYDTGPTWQDHHAGRDDLPGEHRRIRIYLYERQSDAESRESVRHAAQREYLAAQGIEHEPIETYSNGVRHVNVPDPDGNVIAFAEPP